MLKKKCPSCAKKIDRKFSYCPYCGVSFREQNEQKDFGMLGRDDMSKEIREEVKLPFGMNKIMNSLMKQIERQMNDIDFQNTQGMPRGFKIKVSTGKPGQIREINENKQKEIVENYPTSKEEDYRRSKLEKVNAKSRVKRIADSVIYELEVPGVKRKRDVTITKLASGIEIKAYSKDKCYIKSIPLTMEITEYYLENEKLFVEMKA